MILLAPAGTLQAQSADSARWSLFAGRAIPAGAGADQSFGWVAQNFNVGGSIDFRSSLLPVPLRATLSYEKFSGGPSTTYKVTSLHVVGVFRPLPTVMAVRPYLLGGFGVSTQSPSGEQLIENGTPRFIPITRHTTLETQAGVGLEFRRFFVEYRRSPFAVVGHDVSPHATVSMGMRF